MDYSEDIKKLEDSIDRDLKNDYFDTYLPMIAAKIAVLNYLKRKHEHKMEAPVTSEMPDNTMNPKPSVY